MISAPFTVTGHQIFDPKGRLFVPVGTNIPGYQYPYATPLLTTPAPKVVRQTYASLLFNAWKVNCVRLNNFPLATGVTSGNDNIAALIDYFTAHRVVVIVSADDKIGSYYEGTSLSALTSWVRSLATTYKNNGYVWFAISSPDSNVAGPPDHAKWKEMYIQFCDAIRSVGNHNIIVCDAASAGQGVAGGALTPIPDSWSAILTDGPQIISTYGNILFSVNVYDQWDRVTTVNMAQYVDNMIKKRMALMVGGWGGAKIYVPTGARMLGVLKQRGIGRLTSHATTMHTYNQGALDGMFYLNAMYAPSNLAPLGQLLWDDTHKVATPPASMLPSAPSSVTLIEI